MPKTITRGLTDKQNLFAMYYAKNPNATQAAKLAGYASGSAHVQGSALLKISKVQTAIQGYRQPAFKENTRTADELIDVLWAMVDDGGKERLGAATILAKMYGLTDSRVPSTINVDARKQQVLASFTDDQLQSLIAGSEANDIIDAEPNTETP